MKRGSFTMPLWSMRDIRKHVVAETHGSAHLLWVSNRARRDMVCGLKVHLSKYVTRQPDQSVSEMWLLCMVRPERGETPGNH